MTVARDGGDASRRNPEDYLGHKIKAQNGLDESIKKRQSPGN